MAAKANDKEFLQNYKEADPDGRLNIMLKNYIEFPKVIHRIEKTYILMTLMREA